MQQTIPVADFMDCSPASVVIVQETTRHGLSKYVATILDVTSTGAGGIDTRIRQGAEAKNIRR